MQSFFQEERGQDLIEYALLMAFLALAGAALMVGSGPSVNGIWGRANSALTYNGSNTSNPTNNHCGDDRDGCREH